MDTWARITSGREAFADYLGTLTEQHWQTRSLCSDWTVKELAAHMLVIPTKAKGEVFRSFVRSGFNLDRLNAGFVRDLSTTMSGQEIAALTRRSAGSQSRPPGLNLGGVFTELAVHTADISEALAMPFDLPMADYVANLDRLKDVQPVMGAKKRIAGLRLQATDTDWSHGAGPLVSGPAKQLLLAMAGRPTALDHLVGDGLAPLRSR